MKKLGFMALIGVLTLALLAPGLSGAADKPEKIYVAAIGDFSGPYAPVVGSHKPGAEDAWKYINANMGGIQGVSVEPLLRDTGGKVALGLSQYNELINMKPRPLFIDTSLTPLGEALRPRYNEDDILGIQAGAAVSIYPVGNSYAYYCLYPEGLAINIKWYKEHIWKEKRPLRVGLITWDTSYGRAIMVPEFYEYLKTIGVEMAGEPQVFGIRDVEVSTQLMKLRQAKADVLIANNTAGGALAIQKGAKEMGWNIPQLNMGIEEGTLSLDPAIFNGCYAARSIKSWHHTDDPAIKKLSAIMDEYGRGPRDKSYFYFIGWQNALVQHKVLNDVVQKHGWGGLSTKNIKEALNSLKDYRPMDLTSITYSADRPIPRAVQQNEVVNGKLTPRSDWLEVPNMKPAK
ncbi:MAG: ABC transporter substrate-binding protein [Proteobacteria bacterium]|nr:ABC transporter substrate-binding protein [Pseudomonadota bacterium]